MTNTINTAAATLTIPMTINRTKSYKMGRGRLGTRTVTTVLKKDVHAKCGLPGNSKFRAAYSTWILGGFTHVTPTGVIEISKGSLRRYGIQVLKDEGDFIAFQIPSNRKVNKTRLDGLLEQKYNVNAKAKLKNLARGMTHFGIRPDTIAARYANEILCLYGAEVVTYSPSTGKTSNKTDSEAYLVKADGTHVQLEFDKTYRIPANGAKIPANIINL